MNDVQRPTVSEVIVSYAQLEAAVKAMSLEDLRKLAIDAFVSAYGGVPEESEEDGNGHLEFHRRWKESGEIAEELMSNLDDIGLRCEGEA